MEKHEIVVLYKMVADTVKVSDGPLAKPGTVEEIDPEKNKVRVVVSMFGRQTPIELELDQVLHWKRSAPSVRSRPEHPGREWETDPVSPKPVSGIGRPLPHFYEGGAYSWHRKLLVM